MNLKKKEEAGENLALSAALSVLIDCTDFLLKCRMIITPGPSHVDEYMCCTHLALQVINKVTD